MKHKNVRENYATIPWLRQCVGIDVSKSKLNVYLCKMNVESFHYSPEAEFPNTKTGFNRLMKWARRNAESNLPIYFLMEATGCYHESLAFHLHELQQPVYVVNPRKAKNFLRWNYDNLKTDRIDAKGLALMGCKESAKLSLWVAPSPQLLAMRQLTRTIAQLTEQKVTLQNQIHSTRHGKCADSTIIKVQKEMIAFIDKKISELESQIKQTLKQNGELEAMAKRICTIKGIGMRTASVIIAETYGFSIIESRGQLASYAGLGTVIKDSGDHMSKRRISKAGSVHLRKALYMPTLSAMQKEGPIRDTYYRVLRTHPKVAKIAIVAGMRKMLLLSYTLVKNGVDYNPKYGKD